MGLTRWFAALLLVAAGLAAQAREAASPRVEALLARMTVAEKVGQLVQVAGGRQRAPNSLVDEAEHVRIREGRVGAYLNIAGAAETRAVQRIAVEESRLHIPLLLGADVIHGYRTTFPVPLAMASSWDPAVEERAARVAATEASAAGLDWTFAPMIDIARDPRWGRVVEGAGEDPYLGSRMAEAQVRGFQGASLAAPDSILATAKHFAAYGAAAGGRDYDGAELSERALNEIYLPPFHAAARAGAGTFMAAFNTIGGVPAHVNRALLTGILRAQWHWPGLVVSDWNGVGELRVHGVAGSDAEAAARALEAGVDMDMQSGVYAAELERQARGDPAVMAALDSAVRRVLAVKERLGLFENPYRGIAGREAAAMLTPANRAAARAAAERSIVLLKNDGDLLPIAAGARRIAVIGALADDAAAQLGPWHSAGRAEDVRPLLPALRAALPEADIFYVPGASPSSDDASGIPAAVAAARAADLVLLVVGETSDMSGESRSRADIGLPGAQQALADAVLDTGRPIVVLLTNGRPLAIDRLAARAPAILETWFLGVEAGPAIADILTGRASPGGRLPIAFPRASGALPATYAHLPTGRPADPDPAPDTSRYHDLAIGPVFAFGHGLSYTRFDYGPLEIAAGANGAVTASVTVRNVGARPGDEVVQLYARDPVASVSRPVIELRGFRRIALAPGEAKRISFTLTPAQFAIWGAGGRWRIEPGEIELMVGASSADIRARGTFAIAAAGESDVPAAAIATPSSEMPVR
jgi:beta-glucosidase